MFACEETGGKQRGPLQLQSKRRGGGTYIVDVGGSSPFQSNKANMLAFLLGQIVPGEPVHTSNGRGAALSDSEMRLWCGVFRRVPPTGSRSEPCDKLKLINQSLVQSTSPGWRE